MTWFEKITGFPESSYRETQSRLRVEDGWLYSSATDRRFAVGTLETPSLGELRLRVGDLSAEAGRIRIGCIQGDARALHSDPANTGALFQVASQFNLLEMVGPQVGPEDGVTRYVHDRTQGPACAIAAGAGTIFRNYLVELQGQQGQRANRQIDCLADLGQRLGNQENALWSMRNGYALCSEEGLAQIDEALERLSVDQLDDLGTSLRIGYQHNVQVTDVTPRLQLVSQVYCSALPIAYTPLPVHRWERFARLVLNALYEATLLAAVINAREGGSNKVLLTRVGGGAFGNPLPWINAAIARAVRTCKQADLEVSIVCFGQIPQDVSELIGALSAELKSV